MELLYFYIQDHKMVPSSGINFGGELLFHYHREHQELEITENQLYLPDFFIEDPNQNTANALVGNISAIVGENGAGKSTLLNLIKDTFATGALGIKDPFIVAVKEADEIIIYHWEKLIVEPSDVVFKTPIRYHQIAPKKVASHLMDAREVEVIEYPKIPVFDEVDFIFYSNIYDHSAESQIDGIKNISTNYLSGLPHRYKEDDPGTVRIAVPEANDKDEFRYQEIRMQIDLINGFDYKDLIPFDLPDTLIISLRDDLGVKYFPNSNEHNDPWGSKAIYSTLSEMFWFELEEITTMSGRIKHNFIGAAVFNFVQETSGTYSPYIDLQGFIDNRKNNKKSTTFEDAVMHILTNISVNETVYPSEADRKSANWLDLQSLFSQKSTKLAFYIKMIKELKIKKENIAGDNGRTLALYIKRSDQGFLDFYKTYRESFIDQPYLNFSWRNLSSGEKALLTIYARFYSLISENLTRKAALTRRNVIILLDEPDAFLHPAWQKQLVDSLQRFLKTIYAQDLSSQQRRIQIIFTTNNPLSITDLPHNNVVLLKRVDDQLLITDFSDSKRTFAANIFDLYADSFFLNDGYTGSFAIKKINAVFEDLNGTGSISDERKEEIKKIIQLIGEPLIKNKLIEMYHQKEVLANEYDSRLKRLEDQVFKDDRNKKK